MTRFIQLHYLTAYPPSNPNRDDLGHPKTAVYGGVPRLRLSSQSLKRAVRTCERMRSSLEGHLGVRTRRIGETVRAHLLAQGAGESDAGAIAHEITAVFGKIDETAIKRNPAHVRTRQLVFISPEERAAALEWADRRLAGEALPDDLNHRILRSADTAVDLAMFGRMLADDGAYAREAAVQVSHAITTHKATTEEDYYTAVDDLNRPAEEMGAGFVGEALFGAGVYYLYVCVDTDLLLRNLAGARPLAARSVGTLASAFATTTPTGRHASFAHHTRAHYVRAEAGETQPRSLATAFLRPVTGTDLMAASIEALERTCARIDRAYGAQAHTCKTLNVDTDTGSLHEVAAFAAEQITDA